MQDAGNQNAIRLAPEENDMLALFLAVKTRADIVARTA
jgi:hypothetical protein